MKEPCAEGNWTYRKDTKKTLSATSPFSLLPIFWKMTIFVEIKQENQTMCIPEVTSIRPIQMRYGTGEKPVLVECDDLQSYICKYRHSSVSSYKLVCELAGTLLANSWKINTPDVAFVKIRPGDWAQCGNIDLKAPSFGSRKMSGVMDITGASLFGVRRLDEVRKQILKIALFDIWLANEDRNSNNANLLYDLVRNEIVAIDHGCIFNTAAFDCSLTVLTCNETILESPLAHYLLDNEPPEKLGRYIGELLDEYECYTRLAPMLLKAVVDNIPSQWNVPARSVEDKLKELYEENWVRICRDAFMEYINDNGYV